MMRTDSWNIRVRTPDGVMYFTIVEDEQGNIEKILSSAGKTGSTLSLYVDAMCNLVSHIISRKLMSLNEIISVLSHYNTASIVYNEGGVPVRSGIGGLIYAIQKYRKQKAMYDSYDLDI